MAENQTKKRGQTTKRVHEIITILRRYDVLKALGSQTHPEQVRQAFEALGPTFIKIGQMLSTRPDIVAPEFVAELSKLQNSVKTDDFETVKATIEIEFRQPLDTIFQDFHETPLASASMGQVHLARLKNGVQVAVKVQHPGIRKTITTDLNILNRLVKMINWLPTMQIVDPKEIFAQFKTALERELDSHLEAINNQRFYELNNAVGIFQVPQVYLDYCTDKIVTTEYKQGRNFNTYLKAIADQPVTEQRREIAQAIVQNFMKQVFDDGFFHADPHPGNLLIAKEEADFSAFGDHNRPQMLNKKEKLPSYRLIYLDFGMMGTMDKAMISNLADVVIAVNSKDAYKIGSGLLKVCNVTGPLDKNKFFEDLNQFMEPYYNTGLGGLDLEKMTFDIINLCRRHNLQMNPDVTLLIKAFGALEGIVLQLDPDISMLEVARPFTRQYILKHVNFQNELEDRLLDAYQLSKDIPRVANRLKATLDLLERGRLKVGVELNHRDQVLDRIERMVNRIAVAMILAALIMGSSLLVQQDQHTWIARIGIFGYVLAAALIIGFAISTVVHWVRHRRHKGDKGP